MKEKTENKRILVICQNYKPEPFRISDICEELVKRGHEVLVVTGYPNCPAGNLYEGYGKNKRIDETINGVKIHRCYTVPRKTSVVKRIENYYSYAHSSTRYVCSNKCVASDGKPFDIVFCYQLSPIMMAEAAVAYKKKYNVPTIMYTLDLWPESLRAGGIKRGSSIYKYYHRVSEKIYKQMDKILVSSKMFSEYFEKEFGIMDIEYLPQYAEDIFTDTLSKEEDGTYDFMFAGNIGKMQSVETIVETAKILKNEPIRFHIVGDGISYKKIIDDSRGLDNIIFYGRRPLDEMPSLYAKADAMIATLKADPIISLTLPGKIQSYMAAEKPIIGAIDGETKKVIEDAGCGYCGKAEDASELAENIKKFVKDKDKALMGKRGREYFEKNFNKQTFMDKFEEIVRSKE